MIGTIEQRTAELDAAYPIWEKKSIWEYFLDAAKEVPSRDFVISDDGSHITYQQARTRILQMASALHACGVKQNTHVAVQMDNTVEQILLSLAIAAVRAVRVVLNTALGPRELEYGLKQAEAGFLITNCQPRLFETDTPLRLVITAENTSCDTDLPVLSWGEFLQKGRETYFPKLDEQTGDEISDIFFTSGSTGLPKGVPLSHDMLMRSAFANARNRGLEFGRRTLLPVPVFHVFGYVKGVLANLLIRGTILLYRGKFYAQSAVAFMLRERANDVLCVPAQLRLMVTYLQEQPMELPALHAVYCSASVCPSWLWPSAREHLHINDLITGYGMSEICGGSIQTVPGDSNETLRTRVGKLIDAGCAGMPEYNGALLQYQVVDPTTGLSCPPKVPGELWCRGLILTKGYYRDSGITEKAFTPDGWFRTSDCGFFDESGYLCLTGRLDDVYKINGENVAPKFVENTVSDCPFVSVVQIVGLPDARHGAVGAAFLQLQQDTPETRREVERYCKEHLAKFQVPKYYFYYAEEDWPRTASGKIEKKQLRLRAIGALQLNG